MKVWVVIDLDRHVDPDAEVFATAEEAHAYAAASAAELKALRRRERTVWARLLGAAQQIADASWGDDDSIEICITTGLFKDFEAAIAAAKEGGKCKT